MAPVVSAQLCFFLGVVAASCVCRLVCVFVCRRVTPRTVMSRVGGRIFLPLQPPCTWLLRCWSVPFAQQRMPHWYVWWIHWLKDNDNLGPPHRLPLVESAGTVSIVAHIWCALFSLFCLFLWKWSMTLAVFDVPPGDLFWLALLSQTYRHMEVAQGMRYIAFNVYRLFSTTVLYSKTPDFTVTADSTVGQCTRSSFIKSLFQMICEPFQFVV